MRRQIKRLGPPEITRLVKEAKPGLYADDAGLNLRAGPNGSASWRLLDWDYARKVAKLSGAVCVSGDRPDGRRRN